MWNVPQTSRREQVFVRLLLAAIGANCFFQIAWFWRFHAQNITMDAVNYIGLARHLVDGNWIASIHGYWSPLFPWVIAASSFLTHNWTLLGRLLTIGTFLLCLPLLYLLTLRLWQSRIAALFAVLWFSLSRGVIALAVGSILADFLLTACVLGYFIVLLECLRQNRQGSWVLLGFAHAVAFLAKAFAMPWLTISTLLAVVVRNRKSVRKGTVSLLLAGLVPALVWVTWGTILKAKYGVFTTGYQLRQNLMIDLRRHQSHHVRGDDQAFVDTSSVYDVYMVGETSWSDLQRFDMRTPELLTVIAQNELANLPKAVKEVGILLTPGGILALVVGLAALFRQRAQFPAESAFAAISVASLVVLIVAYCMLVFDARYVLPVIPVLMASACGFLVSSEAIPLNLRPRPWIRTTALALTLASIVFFLVYWASPFRVVDRDFEISCYRAAEILRREQPGGQTLVTIGPGPYPEHGIGFETGIYTAYFAGRRVVGMNSALPNSQDIDPLVNAVVAEKADAIVVWGSPANAVYRELVAHLQAANGNVPVHEIADPTKGVVGTLLFPPAHAS